MTTKLIDIIRSEHSDRPVVAPDPNEVPSSFVMECLTADSEGDGILFSTILEGKLLFAAATDSWYVWQGNIWRKDNINLIKGLVRYVTNRYGQEILSLEQKKEESKKTADPEDHKLYVKSWDRKISMLQAKIKALRQEKGRNACIHFSYTHFENPFSIEGNEFDKDPWLLGVKNGVVDLRSGELFPGEPRHMVSQQCSCNYKVFPPGTEEEEITAWLAPWLHFLETIYDGDQEIIEFMQILLGYGITGLTTEHVFPFLLGRGRNGKSQFIGSVMRVLGDYAAMVPCDLFLKNNQPRAANQTDPAIMKLEGLRLAVSSEVEEGSKFSAQQVKRLTGGDVLEGRSPYDKELRNFQPTHLNIMIGNHEPLPPSGDPAFWDRTFLINHPVRFVKENPDPEKDEKLGDPEIDTKLRDLDERILYWMVEGCLKFQAAGKKIIPPASVLKATEEYQADADWIGQFLDACCVRSNKETGASVLYIAFTLWYQENINAKKNQTPTQRAFGLKLKSRGEFPAPRRTDGVYYQGLSLNVEWQRKMMDIEAKSQPQGADDAF